MRSQRFGRKTSGGHKEVSISGVTQHAQAGQGCLTCPLDLAPKGLMPAWVVQGAQEPVGKEQRSCNLRKTNRVPGCSPLFLEACSGVRDWGEIRECLHIQINKISERKRDKI